MQISFKESYYFLLLFLSLTPSLQGSADPPIIAAYYNHKSLQNPPSGNRPPFTPSMIDPSIITDLYFAFAGFGVNINIKNPKSPTLTGDFTIQPLDAKDLTVLYPQILALKQQSKNSLRTLLSIGGWSFNDPNDPEGMGQHTNRLFSQMVSNPSNRKQFIDSAIAYAHRYSFDGIDIDWEYPGDLRRGGSDTDFVNFIEFLKECSTAFKTANPPLLLTVATPATVPYGIPTSYRTNPNSFFRWIASWSQYVDRIHLMAYDYHGPFDVPKITGANAPLNRDTNTNSFLYIAKSVLNYIENGVPANKIILGIPTFGHSYNGVSNLSQDNNGPGKSFETAGFPGPSTLTPGLLSYYEIADLITKLQLVFGTDSLTNTAYGYHIFSRKWVSFDTPATVRLKAELALKQNLKGVMFWSIDMDEYHWEPKFPNIKSARNVFFQDKLFIKDGF